MNKTLRFLLLVLIFVASFIVWYLLGAFITGNYDTTTWSWINKGLYIILGYGTFLQAFKLINKQ